MELMARMAEALATDRTYEQAGELAGIRGGTVHRIETESAECKIGTALQMVHGLGGDEAVARVLAAYEKEIPT